MARPQNGVNGNIPQSNYGYMPQSYNINTQLPRNNNQNLYGYSDMPQVISNHMAAQGYQLNGTVPNNVRPTSPMMAQPQYPYMQYGGFQQQPQYYQYPFSGNYNQPMFIYHQPDPSPAPQPPVTAPPTKPRDKNPLVIFDQSKGTSVDLSTYQNQRDKKPKALLDISVTEKNELIVEEIKAEKVIESAPDEEIKKVAEVSEDVRHENLEESKGPREQCELLKEENVPVVELESIKCPETNTEEMIIEKSKVISPIKENSDFEDGTEQMLAKLVSIPKTIDTTEAYSSTQESNNEDDGESILSANTTENYYLPVDKKESDETTLKRKLTYDRAYLLSIKGHSLSQMKPEKLSLTAEFSDEIIYAESQNISVKKPLSSPTISNNNEKIIKKHPYLSQSQFSKFPQKMSKNQTPKQINLDLNENQIFERSKSGYLPPQLRDKDVEIDHLLELKRNIKSNLNKITPQNFQDCLSEISKLKIQDKEEMSCLINEIFAKAVKEEAYSVTYAQYCVRLSEMYSEDHPFKSQLLKKCQEMFEKPLQDQLDCVRKDWLLKIENESDAKMKSLYESDLEEQVKKAKDKYFGNMRFIGELFLHNLLAGKVILNCFVELLAGKSDHDSLLALCKLMETCGKQIDEKNGPRMNGFILKIHELSESKELETRIRFKLRDIVDMRKRNWALRHIQQEKKINPKTMEEQKEEAAAEAASKLAASQISHKKSHNNQTSAVRRQVSIQPPITVRKLACTSHFNDEPVLGPTKNIWNTGSKPKVKQRDGDIRAVTSQKSMVGTRSPDQSPQIRLRNKYTTLGSSTEGSGADSRSSTPPITHPKNVPRNYVTRKISEHSSMTDDDRATIIFNDIMLKSSYDIESWRQIRQVQPIITHWIDDMMEKDKSCRQNIGDFFTTLIDKGILTTNQLVESSQSFITNVDDLICDIPKLWEFFAQFLERFIHDKNSNISFIQNIFKPLMPRQQVAECLSMTLHAASSRLEHSVVGHVFHKSSLKWEYFVPNNWEAFVKDNGLEFTIARVVTLPSTSGSSLQTIAIELEKILSDAVTNKLSNECVFKYLEENIDKATRKSSECTGTITSCILKAIKNKPESVVRVFLKDKFEIIKQYSQHRTENGIEVLRSILNVANELDKEKLTIIYDFILTGNIVSDDAFSHYMEDDSFTSAPNYDLTAQILSQLNVLDNCR